MKNREVREPLRKNPRARHALERGVLHQVKGGEVEPQEFRQALDQLADDGAQLHLVGHRLTHLDHGFLQTVAFGEEKAVDRTLKALPDGLEKQYNGQGEEHREENRLRHRGSTEQLVRERDGQRIDRSDHRRRHGIKNTLPEDDSDVEHLEADDGVGKGQGHQDRSLTPLRSP